MKPFYFLSATISILCLVLACSSKMYVSSDYDKDIDFSKYQSYNFSKEANESSLDQLTKKRIFNAISENMNKIGFVWSAEPDVIVHYHVNLKKDAKKSKTQTTSTHDSDSYELGDGFKGSYIDGADYSGAAIFIDIIDAEQSRLIWSSINRFELDIAKWRPDKDLSKLIKKMFKSYPPRTK